MKAIVTIDDTQFEIDLNKPISIGIPLNPFGKNPSCFYAGEPQASPMDYQGYICSKEAGAPVNFFRLNIVPHGHGTHTECVGHITDSFNKITDVFENPFCAAELITVQLTHQGEDFVITREELENQIKYDTQALIIRTTPNTSDKCTRDYTESNPPYLTTAAMEYIVSRGYQHLLLDLPSVDREKDEGAVLNHNIFWNTGGEIAQHKTITEMIFVADEILDGKYILNLQISNIVLDAVPSNPLLYLLNQDS